jgi:hypothetical protein
LRDKARRIAVNIAELTELLGRKASLRPPGSPQISILVFYSMLTADEAQRDRGEHCEAAGVVAQVPDNQ